MKGKLTQPTPSWSTWTFCATLDRLDKEVGISTANFHKVRIEIIRASDGWDLYTYEAEAPTDY